MKSLGSQVAAVLEEVKDESEVSERRDSKKRDLDELSHRRELLLGLVRAVYE